VGDIYWNFEKFLIGRDGKPYTRYHPSAIDANDLIPDIDVLLAQAAPAVEAEDLQQHQEQEPVQHFMN